jgi:nitrite reductase/ring-hydroxylating ferredoxin subunit
MSKLSVKWIRIADSIDEFQFSSNNIVEINAGEKTICLGRFDGQIFAFAQKCPHASGFLSEGFIDSIGNVVCPLHRYKFSLKNGRNTSGEGFYLKHWPVEIRDDGVYVGFEANRLFGLF